MKKIFLLLFTLLSLSLSSYSQEYIGIKISYQSNELNVISDILKIYTESDLVKAKSLAYLCGSLSYKCEKEYNKTYLIDSLISIDTVYEKNDILQQLLKYEDTSSYIYGSLNIFRNQIESDKQDLKNKIITQSEYNQYYKEDFTKYKEELNKIESDKNILLKRLKIVNDKDILEYNIKYSIIENYIKSYIIIHNSKVVDGTGFKPWNN